ncbi:alpha/beta fold hydrolase [Kribbella sp. CA-253562]|uniref:alpha/beta fold hydrolase n=1 Tax=Kribbella sp. CA-253562 TaxID=3239942 RepID=UPI003D949D5A
MAQVGSRYADTPIARFHYIQAGSGTPVVLLSPGGTSVIGWKEQVDVLARDHTVYVVDLPGQGYTQLKDSAFAFDLDAMVSAISAFLDSLGVRRAALAGNSWSGGWALAFAQRHPDRVRKLALLDATGLDLRGTWMWESLKVPVIGELAVKLSTGRSTVRGLAEDMMVDKDRVTEQLVDEWWAPMTFHDNIRATYLLERRLDWARTESALPACVIVGGGTLMSKTVLITGASTGIGRATALLLARKGFTVHAGVRKEADGEALGPTVVPITLDVTDAGQIAGVAERLGGQLDHPALRRPTVLVQARHPLPQRRAANGTQAVRRGGRSHRTRLDPHRGGRQAGRRGRTPPGLPRRGRPAAVRHGVPHHGHQRAEGGALGIQPRGRRPRRPARPHRAQTPRALPGRRCPDRPRPALRQARRRRRPQPVGADLTMREKAFVCLTADLCHPHLDVPLAMHVQMALANGVEPESIRELYRHVAPYVGYSVLVTAFQRLDDRGGGHRFDPAAAADARNRSTSRSRPRPGLGRPEVLLPRQAAHPSTTGERP